MDFASVVRQRLDELGLDQRDLAAAADVTESYISQLLGRKKLPPLPNRTDIYDTMSRLLGLPREELARLAALEHRGALDRAWLHTPPARFGPMRELVLRKCRPARQGRMRAIFERETFGEIERVVTRTLIAAARDEARQHARDEAWLRALAASAGMSYRRMRVRLIELFDSDPAVAVGDFSPFLDPLIASWDFDLERFALEVHLTSGAARRFAFREEPSVEPAAEEPGFRAFRRNEALGAGASEEEIEFLRKMKFPASHRPTALFYYRALQALRDPLHFEPRRRRGRAKRPATPSSATP